MKVYVVQQLTWMFNDVTFELSDDVPMKAFESKEDAEAHRARLDEELRERVFPPHWEDDLIMTPQRDTKGRFQFFEVLETELYL